ncbi:helicase-associated domain-containing protein [Kitasatospora sp. NPDC096147]|uniref:helicase-associated domain-containing protein n=1 Tax=Kitasatospora sp. NPDC096147 TaxID=3364093 RepID=UPI00381526D1
MNSTTALAKWLTRRTPEQLTALLEQRGLPHGRPGAADARQVAGQLLAAPSVRLALTGLDRAELQVLTAVVVLAERRHGPVPDAAGRALSGFAGHRSGGWGGAAEELEPSERAVERSELLAALGPRALPLLGPLADRALLLPPHRTLLTVPAALHRPSGGLLGYGRPADALYTDAYLAAEVRRVEDTLGLTPARSRDEAQRAVTALLRDPAAVRALVAGAPPEAARLLTGLAHGSPRLGTGYFRTKYPSDEPGPFTKYLFPPDGSGDPAVAWAAARGLLAPAGPGVVELPYEVGLALRDPARPLLFDPEPPAVGGGWVVAAGGARGVAGGATGAGGAAASAEAQAAATASASQAEVLLRALAARPLALRKAGGIAVRDTARLAKQTGADEARTRLWLDLAANAGLLAPHLEQPPTPTRGRRAAPAPAAQLLPTDRYDEWLGASPAERLLPLVAAWAVTPEVFSRDHGGPAVALTTPQDRTAVPLRRALLAALAGDRPAGHPATTGDGDDAWRSGAAEERGGAGVTSGPRAATGPGETTSPDTATGPGGAAALDEWLTAATWYAPLEVELSTATRDSARATLAEAELLGVVGHGVLTPVGHAVLALLRAGAARCFPAVPGAGPVLDGRPALASAVAELRAALLALIPEPSRAARFQADLTAVVTGPAAPELAELLAGSAERESEGHATVWRFGPASVRRALDAGHDAAELLLRLQEFSIDGAPLPQPLEYLIRDTARTHGRIRVAAAGSCLRSDDEALVLELAHSRPLARLGLRRIAPTVLICPAAPDATLVALREAGYAPVLEAGTGVTVVERAPALRADRPMPELPTGAAELAEAITGGVRAPA